MVTLGHGLLFALCVDLHSDGAGATGNTVDTRGKTTRPQLQTWLSGRALSRAALHTQVKCHLHLTNVLDEGAKILTVIKSQPLATGLLFCMTNLKAVRKYFCCRRSSSSEKALV